MKELFTKSKTFNPEYCCSIVKVGELKAIPNRDRIASTMVNGETIVVRKDQVKEGDIMFYASNETQLNKEFLSVNNLFESGAYEFNSNSTEVKHYVEENKILKRYLETTEKNVQTLENCVNFLRLYDAKYMTAEEEAERMNLQKQHVNSYKNIIKITGTKLTLHSKVDDVITEGEKGILMGKLEIDTLRDNVASNTKAIQANVGFFNKNGRVRSIKLGKVLSMGFLFSLEEMSRWCRSVKDVNLEEMVGIDFDTVKGEEFIKAYVPFVPQQTRRADRQQKAAKKLDRFDRMIKGEFAFHYDTSMFAKCVNEFNPTDTVTVSLKKHGTSVIIGKVHVKYPIKLPVLKRVWNWFVDATHLFKKLRICDYYVDYGNVTSSRKVIKNEYINKNAKQSSFYDVDIWSEYGELIYPYLDEGMTVYGEIIGYLSNTDKYIQKDYDYGCTVGKNKLMPYRITTTKSDGTKHEWKVSEVKEWTEKLIKEHPEIADRIDVIDILYHGTLGNVYPDLSLKEHWHENLLELMRNDRKRFGMEKNEPLCKNSVPREGIVIRVDDAEVPEAYKLKTYAFFEREKLLIDNNEVDMEIGSNQ